MGSRLMGTTFRSVFTTSNFLGSDAILTGAASSAGVVPAGAAFTSGNWAGLPVPICSLLVLVVEFGFVFVRLVLVPEIDFDLAMFGYSLHMPKFMNESSCSANHIHLAPQR